MSRPLALVALIPLLTVSEACSDVHWSVQASVGTALNLPTPLTIRQSQGDDLRLRARYRTRAFQFPLYYALRVTRWDGDRAWALELRHHKLFLENPPDEVQQFSVTHGYNLLTVCRLRRDHGFVTGVGVGVVIAHPENVVRGRVLEETGGPLGGGYYLAGPTAAVLVAREVPLGAG